MWRDIKKVIHQRHQFVLTTHVNPDGDGIGAASALIELLHGLGKKARFICDSPIPDKYQFLNHHNVFESYDPLKTDLSSAEALVVLDANRRERIGRLEKLIDDPKIVSICIDHHPVDKPFTPHSFIDPTASSSGAMVHTLFKECGFDLNLQAATGIYTSILTDTGRFSYSSTTRKAHKIADECIKVGVDPDKIFSHLFQHVPLAHIKMFARSLERMETFCGNRIVVQEIRKEEGDDIEHIDLEYMLEFNKAIDEVECVVLLRELADNQVRVSLRSKTSLDISSVMKKLGGGGHSKAAGANVQGSLSEVKSLIVKMLEELISSNAPSL